jgi:hypothetical protein
MGHTVDAPERIKETEDEGNQWIDRRDVDRTTFAAVQSRMQEFVKWCRPEQLSPADIDPSRSRLPLVKREISTKPVRQPTTPSSIEIAACAQS